MASDKQIKYEVTADPAGFEAAMHKTREAVTGATGKIESEFKKIGGAFEEVQKKLLVLAGLVAGGSFFKAAIDESNKMTGEVMKLARAMGINTEAASALRTALEDIGADTDTYTTAAQKFAGQIKKNEDGVKSMGIVTRDANGNLRDSTELFNEALSTVGQYKPGLDQTTAAMTLFGKSVDEVMKLQKLNNAVIEEARKKNEELGLVVSQENVAAAKAYKMAMNDVGDVMMAVKKTIGDAVMPFFTELAEYFASTGPYVVAVFKGALTGLMAVFRVVQAAVRTLAGAVFEGFNTIIEAGALLGETLSRLFTGDFAGAAQTAGQSLERIKQGVRAVGTEFQAAGDDAESAFRKDFGRIWNKGTTMAAPGKGTRTMGEFGKGGASKPEADKSRMQEWEATLAAQRDAFERMELEQGRFTEFGRNKERDYWKAILADQSLSTQERLSVSQKYYSAERDIRKEAFAAEIAELKSQMDAWKSNFDERLKIAQKVYDQMVVRYGAESKEAKTAMGDILKARSDLAEQTLAKEAFRVQMMRNAQLAEIEAERELEQLRLALRDITQIELLEKERGFEERMFEIKRKALQDDLDLAKQSNKNPLLVEQLNLQIEQLEQQHQLRLGQIQGRAIVEANRPMLSAAASIEGAFAKTMQSILTRSQTVGQALKSLWSSVVGAVIGELSKIVAKMAIDAILQKVLTKATAVSKIAALSGEAGAGGVASMAAAPFPLNLGAPAFGAAMAAAAFAYQAPALAASGGYDIPSGIDPVVQAHAREMILPVKQADVIRDLADGGGARAGDTHVHVSAMDSRDVLRALQSGGALQKAMRELGRNFTPVRA